MCFFAFLSLGIRVDLEATGAPSNDAMLTNIGEWKSNMTWSYFVDFLVFYTFLTHNNVIKRWILGFHFKSACFHLERSSQSRNIDVETW